MKKISTILGILAIAFSSWFFADSYFASSEEVKSLTKDVRYIELFRLNDIIGKYENKYNCYEISVCLSRMNNEDKIIYRKLQEDKRKLLDEIKGAE